MQKESIEKSLGLSDFLIEIPHTTNPDEASSAMAGEVSSSQILLGREDFITNCYESYSLSMQDNRKSRKIFSYWMLGLITTYLVTVLVFVGISHPIHDNVMIMLLGTTSINLVGLIAIVFKYLFSKHDSEFLTTHTTVKGEITTMK